MQVFPAGSAKEAVETATGAQIGAKSGGPGEKTGPRSLWEAASGPGFAPISRSGWGGGNPQRVFRTRFYSDDGERQKRLVRSSKTASDRILRKSGNSPLAEDCKMYV